MKRLEAFEMWTYRRVLKILWVDHVPNSKAHIGQKYRDNRIMSREECCIIWDTQYGKARDMNFFSREIILSLENQENVVPTDGVFHD